MAFITANDGAQIFYKDWGKGQPVLFSHGWPLSGDAWDGQMQFLGSNGYRVIAHDRRSHGRSDQTWDGNHMDQYADDLHALIETLDLKDIVLVVRRGGSPGGSAAARAGAADIDPDAEQHRAQRPCTRSGNENPSAFGASRSP